jgi:hypothetical protein
MQIETHHPLLAARVLIALVLGWNLQCAAAFIISPQAYMGGFGLEGGAGK